jgi:plasmid stabilization system protein ParE
MVKWTPKSERDLDDIREYIAKNFNVDLAIKIVNGLIDYTESLLSSNPLAGSILESNPLFCKLTYEGNSIYYCENPKDKNIYIIYVQARKSHFQNDRIGNNEVA